MQRKFLISIVLTLGLLILAVGAVGVGLMFADPPDTSTAENSTGSSIGGPFELVNTKGETVHAEDFRGDYMLIYFGYTYCPDVCPTALVEMSRGLQKLAETAPEKAKQVTPVFISTDPARDDVPMMRAYVKNFHDRLVGLTGSPEQVKAAAKQFHVYYEKAQGDRPEGEYLMNHSSYVYLMGPDGQYIDHFTHKAKAAGVAEGLAKMVKG